MKVSTRKDIVRNGKAALREQVERQFWESCTIGRDLDDRDVAEFWRRVREVARVLTG